MIRRFQALAFAAGLCLAAPPLAAQISPSDPFGVERAGRDADVRHPRHERGHRHERWRLERRGERLERHGDRMERRGRSWERRGERLERRGYEHRGRAWQRKAERLQHRGDRLEHRGERLERKAERGRHHRHPQARYRLDGRI